MNLKGTIAEILNTCKAQVLQNMQTLNINASGRTAASLDVQTDAKGGRLGLFGTGHAPLGTLEIGRQGGKVPAGFYLIIQQWTRDKGLSFSSERERKTFSYFVARKIAREGTQRHKIPVDVYSTPAKMAKKNAERRILHGIQEIITHAIHNG